MMVITCGEIRALGISKYLSSSITKRLVPISKKGRANQYQANEVLDVVDILIESAKTRAKTKNSLLSLEIELSVLIALDKMNVTDEIKKSARKSIEAIVSTKRKIQRSQKKLESTLKESTDPLILATTLGKNNIVRRGD
jgi:CagE, TrbE, VirB family, component of type IV transporter system